MAIGTKAPKGNAAKGTSKGKPSTPAPKKAAPKQEGYDDTNRFVLFPNDKDGNENRPDYTGNITLEDGRKLRLAAWLKTSDKVGEYLSGQVSEMQEA